MVEAVIGLLVVILSLVAHYLKFRLSKEGLQKQEIANLEKKIQDIRKALDNNDIDRITAILADQHDRVQQALRHD